MNQKESIVIEAARLSNVLRLISHKWLHTAKNCRNEVAGHELAAAADALYTHLNNFPEIMGSDTGKPAFDEPDNEEFQSDMNNLWEHE